MRWLRRVMDARGSTLLDVLVGLTLMAVATGGMFAGFKGVLTAWTTAQQFAGEQHNARTVLEWTTRRLRMAGYRYTGVPIAVADTQQVVFFGDTDGDGQPEWHRIYLNTAQQVVYVHVCPAADTACRSLPGQPLTTATEARRVTVTGLTLRYFDDAGAEAGNELTNRPLSLADRVRVRRVEMTIQVHGTQLPAPLGMTSQVFVRR